ncbi:MAG: ATP-binding protein [Gemmatimonadota bacterium]
MISQHGRDFVDLERLTAVSRALTYAASVDDVLDITVDTACELLGAPRAVLLLRDQSDLLRVRAARGVDPETVDRFREPLDETLIERLNALFGPEASERFLGVPLVVRSRVTGLLAVMTREDSEDERAEWLLSALADQASVALAAAGEEEARRTERRIHELEEQEARREEALRIVGHDMRSPLSSLRGYIHLLQAGTYGPVTEGQQAALERLEAIAGHLSALVTNALEMSRLAAGQLQLQCGPVHVGRVITEAIEIVELRAREAGITLDVEAPPELVALADADRLRQVLVQLLDNGIKFSPARTAIRIRAAHEPGPPERVVIRVSDQGPGIDPDWSEDIFEPYRRLGHAGGGFGLGLAIARAVTEIMDGDLALAHSDEPGATFVVRLPAA